MSTITTISPNSKQPGTKEAKCLVKNWNRATNKWVACNAELSWVTCNLRDHIKGVHKDLVPYKDLDQHYTEITSAEFCRIREDGNVPVVPQVPVSTATNILTSFKKQRKEGTPRILLKCSIIGMLPLGLLENN